tara:strand:- start:1450 stop:3510 length:2061 start_codon:yes stop_codon:yes gene_type:complete
MAEEIIVDENISIRDAFKLVGRDTTVTKNAKTRVETIRPNPTLKNLEKAGISIDSPFTVLGDEDNNIKLAKTVMGDTGKRGNSNFVTLGSVEQELRSIYERKTRKPFPMILMYGATGQLQKAPDLMKKYGEQFKQPRREDKFKKIPPAEISLKNIANGIAEIPDLDTRAAVAFNSLVPLRPSEITSLKAEDIDFNTGAISEEWKRVNKIRNPVELPEIALSILKNQKLKGNEFLFGDVESKEMTAAVKKYVAPKFSEFVKGSEGMGREIRGAKDLRKIIPSIIASQLDQGKYISQIMGHTKYDQITDTLSKMTQDRYLSPIMNKTGATPKVALIALQNMYGEVLKLESINSLGSQFGLVLPELEVKGSPRINVIPKDQDILSDVRIKGDLTDVDVGLIEEAREARKVKFAREISEDTLGKIQADIKIEEAKPALLDLKKQTMDQDIDFQLEKAEVKAAKVADRRKFKKIEEDKLAKEVSENRDTNIKNSEADVNTKLGNKKIYGKFLMGAGLVYGLNFIPSDYNAAQAANLQALEGDDDSFEARMRRGASNVLGPNVAAGVEAGAKFLDPGIQMAAELGPEAVKETFGASTVANATLNNDPLAQIKTGDQIRAGQQVMQDKADQQQYRGEVSSQVDDELAIQKQMNMKKQSEGFGREAEKKSQLTLEQQIETLLQEKQGGANYAQQ